MAIECILHHDDYFDDRSQQIMVYKIQNCQPKKSNSLTGGRLITLLGKHKEYLTDIYKIDSVQILTISLLQLVQRVIIYNYININTTATLHPILLQLGTTRLVNKNNPHLPSPIRAAAGGGSIQPS